MNSRIIAIASSTLIFLLGSCRTSNISAKLQDVASGAGSGNLTPILKCEPSERRCPGIAWANGLTFGVFSWEASGDGRSLKVQLWKRNETGWAPPKSYSADLTSVVLGRTNDNFKFSFDTNVFYFHTSDTVQTYYYVAELDETTSSIVVKQLSPIRTRGGLRHEPLTDNNNYSHDGKSFLTKDYMNAWYGRDRREGWSLYSAGNYKTPAKLIYQSPEYFVGENLPPIVYGNYVIHQIGQKYNIFEMASGKLKGSIPQELVWYNSQLKYVDMKNIIGPYPLVLLPWKEGAVTFLDKEGFVRELNLENGSSIKKGKLPGFDKYVGGQPGSSHYFRFFKNHVYYYSDHNRIMSTADELYRLDSRQKLNLTDCKHETRDKKFNLADIDSTGKFMILRDSNFWGANLYYVCEIETGNVALKYDVNKGDGFMEFKNDFGDIFIQEQFNVFFVSMNAVYSRNLSSNSGSDSSTVVNSDSVSNPSQLYDCNRDYSKIRTSGSGTCMNASSGACYRYSGGEVIYSGGAVSCSQ